MKRRTKFVRLFCLIGLGGIMGGVLFRGVDGVGALDYQSNVGVGFTFNPSLSVSLSSSDLMIPGLALGATGVSNEINVAVSTNIVEGYTLSATVGNNSTYNGDSLYNSVDNTKIFANVATNANLASLGTDNTWGYSYKDNTVATPAWSNYNGLPLYSGTAVALLDKDDASSGSVDFKIAAKAGSSQASGEYNNVINFTAVSNILPTTMLDAFIASGAKMHNGYFKMQDMTPTICKSIDTDGEKGMQLIDVRDDKVYWVAKLKDNNCWMTQNLDLDLSHEVALTSETSDIDPESYGKTIYTTETGYSKNKDTGVVSWLPSTIDSGGVQRADTIDMVWSSDTAATVPGWANDNNKPYSADPGERYRYTNPTSYNEATYASLENCASANNNDISGCQHSHFGNYYNWTAAVASNNTSSASNGSTQTNSVCPKNWDLPANGEYATLMVEQGVLVSGGTYATDGFNKLRTAPLYYQRLGYFDGSSLIFLGGLGYYWSSTVYSSSDAYYLLFSVSGIWPSYNSGRYNGFSVRCMVGT